MSKAKIIVNSIGFAICLGGLIWSSIMERKLKRECEEEFMAFLNQQRNDKNEIEAEAEEKAE